MKTKLKIANFNSRILLIVLVSFVFTNTYFIVNIYNSKINSSEMGTLDRLESISRTISSQIDGTIYKMLIERYTEIDDVKDKYSDPYYREIVEILADAARLNNIPTDIYTLTLDSVGGYFFFGMTSAEKQYFRHRYELHPQSLIDNYLTGGTIPMYKDEHGTWLSAFSPIRDNNGHVVAVVQVDMPFDTFIQAARSNLYANIFFSLLLIVIITLLMFYWLRLLLNREGKMVQELADNHEIIAKKNEDITASISYAKRIQSSLMDSENTLKSFFQNSFIFYKPKDIVSGDFYWIHSLNKENSRIAVAVADCTGHGVPGALVSVLGITFLRDIVNKNKAIDPSNILKELNHRIIHTFKQQDEELSTKDGMDISLCIIDKENHKISYSGAYQPLIIFGKDSFTETSGDKKPIGGDHFKKDRDFTCHEIAYNSGDWIYMFSDGYVDQFGGERKRKYMKKRFKEKLELIKAETGQRQAELLKKEIEEWMGEVEQVDDITVMGIQLI